MGKKSPTSPPKQSSLRIGRHPSSGTTQIHHSGQISRYGSILLTPLTIQPLLYPSPLIFTSWVGIIGIILLTETLYTTHITMDTYNLSPRHQRYTTSILP